MKKRVHRLELNGSGVADLNREVPMMFWYGTDTIQKRPDILSGAKSSAAENSKPVIIRQNIMLRGNEEREMEYGFGVAGLNGCRKILYAISSDGTACYSGDVFQNRERHAEVCIVRYR